MNLLHLFLLLCGHDSNSSQDGQSNEKTMILNGCYWENQIFLATEELKNFKLKNKLQHD
jgi:hypothetical protein